MDLLHHLAVPCEPSPIRYLIEGFGRLSDERVGLGKRVLAGEVPEPKGEQEDVVHSVVEQAVRRGSPMLAVGSSGRHR